MVEFDGRLIAVTAADPAKAFTLSRDVFVLDSVVGRLSKLTSFPNVWSQVATNSQGFVNVSQAGYTMPWFKAFSPDSKRLAVSADVVSGATFTYTNTLSPSDNSLASGFTALPSLKSKLPMGLRKPIAKADRPLRGWVPKPTTPSETPVFKGLPESEAHKRCKLEIYDTLLRQANVTKVRLEIDNITTDTNSVNLRFGAPSFLPDNAGTGTLPATYTVLSSPSLSSTKWQQVGVVINGDELMHIVTAPSSGAAQFYKLSAVYPSGN